MENTFVVFKYPDGSVDIRGPISGDVDEKLDKVYADYMLRDDWKNIPNVEIIHSFARTKEEFMEEYYG